MHDFCEESVMIHADDIEQSGDWEEQERIILQVSKREEHGGARKR